MIKNLAISLIGLILGSIVGFILITSISNPSKPASVVLSSPPLQARKEVLGFLPYWFLDKAKTDYSSVITTLNYFSLTLDKDGTILKSTNPVELEPGYAALMGGKADAFLTSARQNNIKLSLTAFAGDQGTINQLISDPITNANNLLSDIAPIMSKYGFSDLNLDIEGIGYASPSAQLNYQSFVSEVKNQISTRNLGYSLSIDIIPSDFLRNDRLTIPSNLVKFVDKVILMAYDFHSPSSFVTGPVAPLYGGGTVAEFDTQVAIGAALKSYNPAKILLGFPFYGYSWETLNENPRGAIIPSSALIESNSDIENLLSNCSSCSASFDNVAQESYLIYKNQETNTFQQIFYPDARSVQSKIDFVNGNNLGGLAIWALGYEGNSILTPLQSLLSRH